MITIKRINEFKAKESKGDELFEFLKSIISFIKSSEGNISCEVLRSCENPLKFIVLEEWTNAELHKKSVQAFPAEKMKSAIDLLEIPPKGEYYSNN